MSKKQWLLVILVLVGVGYLIVSKVSPEAGWSIDNIVGGTIGSVKTSIEATPLWQQYDVWFSAVFFTTVTALVMWKGHGIYNSIRGKMVHSAAKEAGWQTTPPVTATPQPVAQTPQAPPTPVQTQTEQPKE